MLEYLETITLLFLPWASGAIVVYAAWSRVYPARFAAAFGYGLPVGFLITVSAMLMVDWIGFEQAALLPVMSLLFVGSMSVVALIFMLRRESKLYDGYESGGWRESKISKLASLMSIVILAFIAIRLGVIALEGIWRPIFAWDAWDLWALRTKVWWEHGKLVPFCDEWLIEGRSAEKCHYTDRMGRHPPAIPLIKLWTTIALGGYSDKLITIPWSMLVFALPAALYAQLRAMGVGSAISLVGAYVIISLPIVGTHLALGGYADIWVLPYVLMTAGAVYLLLNRREWRNLLFALMGAVGILLTKETGILILAAFLVALFFTLIPMRVSTIVCLGAAGILLIVSRFYEMSWSHGNLGYFSIGPSGIDMPGYTSIWGHLVQNWFQDASWHLFWFMLGPICIVSMHYARTNIGLKFLVSFAVISILGLLILFSFSRASLWVILGTSVNRIPLHFLGAWILMMFLSISMVIHGFEQRRGLQQGINPRVESLE